MSMKHFHKGSNRKRSGARGFTIFELVLVLALLGLLSGLVITRVGGIWGGAQEKTARFHVNQTFKTPLLKYRIDMGSYPTTDEGLKALLEAPANRKHLWKGPYVDSIPVDPWNNAYEYRYPGEKNTLDYDLRCAGPDGQMNTADDIGNWKSE